MSRKGSIAALSAALLMSAVMTTQAADKNTSISVANGAVDFEAFG